MQQILSRSAYRNITNFSRQAAFQAVWTRNLLGATNSDVLSKKQDEQTQLVELNKQLQQDVTSAWMLLRQEGKQQEAISQLEQLMQKADTELGRKYGIYSGLAQQLCIVNFSTGDMVKAEECARIAMEDHEKKMGKEAIPTAMVGSRLGAALLVQGKLEEAAPYLDESYAYLMKKFDSWWARTFGFSFAVRVGGDVVIYKAILDLVRAETVRDVEYWKGDLLKAFRQVSQMLQNSNYQLKNLELGLRQHYWTIGQHMNRDESEIKPDVINAIFDQHLSILNHIGKQQHLNRIFTVSVQKAVWQYSIGQYQQATKLLQNALKFNDIDEASMPQVRLRLGMCLVGMENFAQAREQLSSVIQYYKRDAKMRMEQQEGEAVQVGGEEGEGNEVQQGDQDPFVMEAKIGLLLSSGIESEGLYASVMLHQLKELYGEENMVVKGGRLLIEQHQQQILRAHT
eukprot:TRINITY_DN45560_c0_g2_i1.p1 TRINITY_DN45560_c0_g2~~TRINITY_DN45560_c0_g2_i1.p1  ORF type:complete len:486 (+),score=58.77 TRINITY_DN45560_c0_g2_i1:94-1458(+)